MTKTASADVHSVAENMFVFFKYKATSAGYIKEGVFLNS